MRQLGIYDAAAQTRSSPLQTALQQPRPRPMPRQMRGADLRALDPNAGVRRQAQRELSMRETALSDPRTAPRAPVTNQFAEAGAMALEGTGLPAVRRGAANITRGAMNRDPVQGLQQLGGGAVEFGLGALGAATIGEFGAVRPRPVPAPRAPMPAVPEPMPRMTRPPTEIAPNGMPIRPAQPFRNSLRGGNDDLAEAAGFGRAPDVGGGRGGNAYVEQLRAEGFNVDLPLYHGTDRDFADFDRARVGENYGDRSFGISFTPDPEEAWRYAGKRGGGSVIRPVYVRYRNPLVFDAPNARAANETIDAAARRGDLAKAIAEAEAAGRPYDAIVGMGPNDEVFQVNILNPSDVAPRVGRAPGPNAPARSNAEAASMRAPTDGQALQAPTLPANGVDRSAGRGIFGPPPRPGVRDMQPEGIYGEAGGRYGGGMGNEPPSNNVTPLTPRRSPAIEENKPEGSLSGGWVQSGSPAEREAMARANDWLSMGSDHPEFTARVTPPDGAYRIRWVPHSPHTGADIWTSKNAVERVIHSAEELRRLSADAARGGDFIQVMDANGTWMPVGRRPPWTTAVRVAGVLSPENAESVFRALQHRYQFHALRQGELGANASGAAQQVNPPTASVTRFPSSRPTDK